MSTDIAQHAQNQVQAQAQQGRRNLGQTSPPSTSTTMNSGGGVLYSTMDGVNNRPRSSINGYSGSTNLNGPCPPNGVNNTNGGLNGSPHGGHANTNGMMNGSSSGVQNGIVNGIHSGGGIANNNGVGLNVTPTMSSPGEMGRMGPSLASPNPHHAHHHHSQQHAYQQQQQNSSQFGTIHAGQSHPGAPSHSNLPAHVWQPTPDVDYSPNLSDDGDDFDNNIELHVGVAGGNWGKKSMKGARWVRRGKAVAWGPARGEWEAEERARKRLKTLMGPPRSPSPPALPHLREPSPPRGTSYTYSYSNGAISSIHGSFSAFVLDPSVAHSYCTHLLDDLQQTTENLVQGEATLTRALGRLWKVLSEEEHTRLDLEGSNVLSDPRGNSGSSAKKDKNGGVHEEANEYVDGDEVTLEDEDGSGQDMSERERRLSRAPSLVSTVHKLFLTPLPDDGSSILEPSHIGSPEMQQDSMEKAFTTLRELGDDSREYVERLAEIRECLGDVKRQRNVIWMKTREQALEELKEIEQTVVDTDELGPDYVYEEY